MITLESPEILVLEKEGDKDAITTVKLYLFINIMHKLYLLFYERKMIAIALLLKEGKLWSRILNNLTNAAHKSISINYLKLEYI